MKRGSLMQRIKYYSFRICAVFLPYDAVKSYFYRVQTAFNHLDTEKVVTDGSYRYEKESIMRNWVTNLEQIQFENEYFLSFHSKEDYLTYFYGDYMKLPPEDQRNRHEMKHVDFGKYRI